MENKLELIELNGRARDFLNLEVHDFQKNLVSSVAESYADALFLSPDGDQTPALWIRGVLRNSAPAAFIMCTDPTEQHKDPWLWRLLVDKSHQGFGVGKFAVEAVISRYRSMGCDRILACFVPADDPATDSSMFYKKLGFRETGETWDDELVVEYRL